MPSFLGRGARGRFLLDSRLRGNDAGAGNVNRQRTPSIPKRPAPLSLGVHLLWAFAAAFFASLLLVFTMGLGIPALVLAAFCLIGWLWAVVSAARTNGPRGLWTLLTSLTFIVPAVLFWYLANGCPGGNVCY